MNRHPLPAMFSALALALSVTTACDRASKPTGDTAKAAESKSEPVPKADAKMASFAKDAAAVDQCDAVLIPAISTSQTSTSIRVAWLETITEQTFESAKSAAGGGLSFLGIGASASWDQFQEARKNYIKSSSLNYSTDEARSILRQSLEPAQLAAWTACMTIDAVGLTVLLDHENKDGANATFLYKGTPDTRIKVKLKITGGTFTPSDASFSLPDHGSHAIRISRASEQAPIYVIANAGVLSVTAASIVAPPPPAEPRCSHPALISINASATNPNLTDGSTTTGMNFGAFAPQTVFIDLGSPMIVSRILFVPAQSPPGYTIHNVTGEKASGQKVVLGALDGITIDKGEFWLPIDIASGAGVRRIEVQTVKSPSWVAWWEIDVYGCRASDPQ